MNLYKPAFGALLLVFLFFNQPVYTQTCGFGCLGLSGVYAGYTFQEYSSAGLNNYISQLYDFQSNPSSKIEFGSGQGFRLGANFFRAKFDEFFLTAKGFYQFLDETHQVSSRRDEGRLTDDLELELNYWGLGIDFGIPLLRFLDLKVVEGGITFYSTELKSRIKINTNKMSESKFESSDLSVGYWVGSGLIVHIIPDYLSLEGTAIFTVLAIDDLSSDPEQTIPPSAGSKKFIDKGGFGATVHLNLGLPL